MHSYIFAGTTPECIALAEAGDCGFYNCFQQRFPCSVFETSHVTDFEFPACQDLESQGGLLEGARAQTRCNVSQDGVLQLDQSETQSCDGRVVSFPKHPCLKV